VKPTFIGIGVQKCATTWLYDILSQHPGICMSQKKELDFFTYWWDQGYQKYEENFTTLNDKNAIGEISPSYFYDIDAPKRIHDYNSDIKIIVMFRNPIERIVSNHKHEIRVGNLKGSDVSVETGLRNNPSYIEQSCYASHLKRWLNYFDSESILVVFFEDVVNKPQQTIREVYRFIGVDEAFSPEKITEKSNESYVFKSNVLGQMVSYIRKIIRNYGMSFLWDLLVKLGVRNIYRKHNRKTNFDEIPKLKQETKDKFKKIFEPEIAELENITGRCLEDWK